MLLKSAVEIVNLQTEKKKTLRWLELNLLKRKNHLKEYLEEVGNVWVMAKEKWQMHSAHAGKSAGELLIYWFWSWI